MANFRLVISGMIAGILCWFALFTMTVPSAAAREALLGARKERHAIVLKAIHRTHRIIRQAAVAISKGNAEKETFRNAVVHQQAARAALRRNKPAVAMHLTLEARKLARKAIQANSANLAPEDATDDAQEMSASQGVNEKEAHTFAAAAEKSVGSAEACAKANDSCDKD